MGASFTVLTFGVSVIIEPGLLGSRMCRRAGDRSGSTNRPLPRRSATRCLQGRCRRSPRWTACPMASTSASARPAAGTDGGTTGRERPLGEMSRSLPDYVCTDCRHGRWNDGRQQAGRATGRRTPAATVIVVPTVRQASGVGERVRTCSAVKRDGTPCRNGAMAGSLFCGPHFTDGGSAKPASNPCRGTTKAGKPCRAGAVRGSEYCPQHRPLR